MNVDEKICVSLSGCTFPVALEAVKKYTLVEIRADLQRFNLDHYRELFHAANQLVFTCRENEAMDDSMRLKLYKLAGEHPNCLLDFDLQNDRQLINRFQGRTENHRLILSWHEFGPFPEDDVISLVAGSIKAFGPGIMKLAFRLDSVQQNSRLLSLYKEYPGAILFGMGDSGRLSRIAAPLFGAPFTYAYADGLDSTAPGQLSFTETKTALTLLMNKASYEID